MMRLFQLLAALLCLLAAPATAQTGSAQAGIDSLLAADRGFSVAAAQATDAASGLAPMFDAEIVMPMRGRGHVVGREAVLAAFRDSPVFRGGSMQWIPVRAGISADGTQGFTYGFTERKVSGQPDAHGKYVAYWVKKPAGWRVAALKLVPRADGAVSTELRAPALPAKLVGEGSAAKIARYKAEIDRTERAFSDAAQVTSLGAAFKKYGSADAMNVGGGADFVYGNAAIGEAQGGDAPAPSPLRWAPDGVIAASSGDLGITYGYLERNGPTPPGRLSRIPWITVWRRERPGQPWLYVAE